MAMRIVRTLLIGPFVFGLAACQAARADGAQAGAAPRQILHKDYAWSALPAGSKMPEDRIEVTADSAGAFEFLVSSTGGARPFLRALWKEAGSGQWVTYTSGLQRRWPVQKGDTMALQVTQFGGREMAFHVSVLFHPGAEPVATAVTTPNIRVSCGDNPRLREQVLQIQEYFTVISDQVQKKTFDLAMANVAHLKDHVARMKETVEALRAADPHLTCSIAVKGLPTNRSLENAARLRALQQKWIEMGTIARGNQVEISRILASQADLLSANVVKAVFKNYLNWGNSIPSSPEAILSLLGPTASLVPWDLPRGAKGWLDDAERDASILGNQVRTMSVLRDLLAFYERRRDDADREAKAFNRALTDMQPDACARIDADLRTFFSGQKHLTWQQ